MRPELLNLASDLVRRGEPFALATVVRRQAASSSQPGDGALITAAGEFHGWLGGSCTQPTVVREALHAIADGLPRLIALSPDPRKDTRPGVVVFPMTCHSGGSVDIYLEPVLPPARFLIFGMSPVARSLAKIARAAGFAVDAADPEADRAAFPDADRLWAELPLPERKRGGRPFAVVATMGERDEESVLAAIAMDPAYCGVVASGKRFAQIRDTLLARGTSAEALARVKSPAGLDIGARSPEEIAVSILAEVVAVRRKAADEAAPAPLRDATVATDPVCGMTVEVAGARHRADVGGAAYYFCCGGCREKFLAAPERFAPAAGAGSAS